MSRLISLSFLFSILAIGVAARPQNNTSSPDQSTPAIPKTAKSAQRKVMPSVLLDTDDACRLSVDGEDRGMIDPSASKKVSVNIGDHAFKCVVESAPDLVWRKVVEVKGAGQVAAIISLKTVHLQHDQGIEQAKLEKERASAPEQKQRAQAQAAAEAAEQKRKLLEANKRKTLDRLLQLQGEWHSDSKNMVNYNRLCTAKEEIHRVLSISNINADSGVASGTFTLNSDRAPTTATAIFSGFNHANCSVLANGDSAISFVMQEYEVKASCGTDDAQSCRVQVKATSCDPDNCNTSFSFEVEVDGQTLTSRMGNEVLTFSRQ
jgi:hypothetical protein